MSASYWLVSAGLQYDCSTPSNATALVCQPIQGNGGGPKLVVRPEYLAGEGVEVLAKPADHELL